ncbi:MAG TPA: ribosomal protein S18-alanine N-acetyltransferase [Burkholderiales bacterium]|nr:ribosomal protein S18-alanine N-acetyltransferase [Burkholderiales bacterium]
MSAVLAPRPRFEIMRPADLDEVVTIERSVYEFPWTPGNFRDSIRAGYDCRVYRSEHGTLIGYGVLMAGVDEAHLLNISVAAACQRHGYGSQLLEHFIDLTRARRLESIYLEVRPSNHVARRLYQRRGFRQVGLRRGYYPAVDGREDALVLKLAV